MIYVTYSKGTPEERALIADHLKKSGKTPVYTLEEKEGEYACFRQLQNMVKCLPHCGVIIPEYNTLGEDDYIRLENMLFLIRNRAKCAFIQGDGIDERHHIAAAAKHYSGFLYEKNTGYGAKMPSILSANGFKRKPPFGYTVVDGRAVIDSEDAKTVGLIFDMYLNGGRIGDIVRFLKLNNLVGNNFSNMTVKTILKNRHYLGMESKKGYKLDPIITYRVWLRTKERFEREYGTETPLWPFVRRISSDESYSFRRSESAGAGYGNGYIISSGALERELLRLTADIASEDNAIRLYNDYVVPERERAKQAYPEALSEYNDAVRCFNKELDNVKKGDVSRPAQEKLEASKDRSIVYAMRLRRIRTEEELFGVTPDEIGEFFERARRLSKLSREEQEFITRTFISHVRIKNGRAYAYVRTPLCGKRERTELNNILF